MKTCSRCQCLKPLADYGKDKSRKDGLTVYCKICAREASRKADLKYRKAHPDRIAAKNLVQRNRPETVARRKKYDYERYWQNVEYHRSRVVQYFQANPEKRKDNRIAHWKRNPNARNDARKKRYALKVQATPLWANVGYMNLWRRLAKAEGLRTGKNVEVDHIIPLQSKKVCGLHCEDNMQLLFQDENRKKQHVTWPQMW